ncbi:hypothetical protein [Caldibacillus thermoamylovorans]|uniref:hypothetical protein n=1 Tax=Caldibacillus thermoamylovorans TaxID=35841 RepID=UPI00203F46DF|nr:hypothetical protein [Caldibacillus thermoamylovorans]MCM3053666.1 hypothetical protein [Caldibacillus thermoamylovorans]
MADAPKINPKETLRESYPKLNQAIDNANEAIKKSTTSDINAAKALTTANSVQEQFNQVVIEGDSSVEAAQARVSSTGTTYTTLKERLDQEHESVTTQLAEIPKDLIKLKRSALLNNNFIELPYVTNVNGDFTFEVGTFETDEDQLFKVVSNGVGSFALLLSEYVIPNQKLLFKFVTKVNKPNISIKVYLNGMTSKKVINLGDVDVWNTNYFEITQNEIMGYDHLYIEFSDPVEIYFRELNVSLVEENYFSEVPITFPEVNERISQPNNKYHNSQGAIEALIRVGQTYENNKDKIIYGNSKTALDVETSQIDGKWELDCSSFVGLVLQGITFEKSRYNGMNNIRDPLFFKNLNTDKYRYANQLAYFAVNHGYAYKPNKDFTNVEPGDVIFFSWNNSPNSDFKDRAFMQIEHVGFFLNKRNSDTKPLYDFLQYYESNSNSVYYTSEQNYVDQAVMAARFPLANMESIFDANNLIVDGDKIRTKVDVNGFGGLKLIKPLRKGKYYTVIMKATIAAPSYFILGNYDWEPIYHTWDETPNEKGVYVFHFPYLKDKESDLLTISVTNQTTLEGASIDWIMLFEGYRYPIDDYLESSNNKIISSATLETTLPTLDSNLKPRNKVIRNGNIVTLEINLPFTEWQIGNIVLGKINSQYAPREDVNIPCLFRTGYAGSPVMFGYVQIWTNGQLNLRPIATETQYKEIIINGSYTL